MKNSTRDAIFFSSSLVVAGAVLPAIAFGILAAGMFSLPVGAVTGVLTGALELAVWRRALRQRLAPHSPHESKVLTLMERSNEARRSSIRDESTGLLNRWYLERRLEEESARCKRYGYSMAVVVVKASIVDQAGISSEGWQVEAASAAQRCANVVRNVDLSAALAPFEFAICLVHCDHEGAERAIERMIAELSEYECAAGIAVYPEDDCHPRAMIELARLRSRRHPTPVSAVA